MSPQIYVITGPTGKQYVGATSYPMRKRIREHLCFARTGRKYPLHEDIRRFGWDKFTIDVVAECAALENRHELEQYFIQLLDSHNNGYNRSDGGQGTNGVKYSDEQRKANSERSKELAKKRGRKYHSDRAKRAWADPDIRCRYIASAKRMADPEIMRQRGAKGLAVKYKSLSRFSVYDKKTNQLLWNGKSRSECAQKLGISAHQITRFLSGGRISRRFIFTKDGGGLSV